MYVMSTEKQKLLVQYLLSNSNIFTICYGILVPEQFDKQFHQCLNFAVNYFDQYHCLPTQAQLLAETGYELDRKEYFTGDEIEYATNEIEQFCKRSSVQSALLKCPDLEQRGDYGHIVKILSDAIAVGLHRDMGLDYFLDPEARLKRMLETQHPIPTGYMELDNFLNGGVNRQEVTLFMANSGKGKSVFKANIAINFINQGLHGIYATLELSEDVCAKRLDSIVTGINQSDIFSCITKVDHEVKMSNEKTGGSLMIKRFPESVTNVNHIRAYIKEYEMLYNRKPDFLIIDYLDLMTSNLKISAENLFVKDKYISEEIRGLAAEFNMVVCTSSQMGRNALLETADIGQGHIQGGISKVNTTDNLIAIIQNDAMKSAGEYMLKLVKTRSSENAGRSLLLIWNSKNLRITNPSSRTIESFKKDKDKYQTIAENSLIEDIEKVTALANEIGDINTDEETQDILTLIRNKV